MAKAVGFGGVFLNMDITVESPVRIWPGALLAADRHGYATLL